ncbi:MAG: YraN family protein [Clostridiales Family XIII bacterium]|jgi:putative endonuclease|nr:YraN family protein [Clostridiales Family XIII bacterium]
MKLGPKGEAIAASYLEARGYEIMFRNFSCTLGEIAIIARRNDTICFIDVKSRQGARYGRPAEAVTVMKQKRIRQTATYFLFSRWARLPVHGDTCFRFDVVEVFCAGANASVEHIESAF